MIRQSVAIPWILVFALMIIIRNLAHHQEQKASALSFEWTEPSVTCIVPPSMVSLRDLSCVEYIDETGQRVGIVAPLSNARVQLPDTQLAMLQPTLMRRRLE